ncbi:N-acetyltransferase [Parasedimentitalea marina]|uniref:N-acetyltransferase n=1 Tax=Parasedimentitalea marina TaxID=2483033 RepID=A0A3T0N0A6_9RHOB|nr:GNAT family N-acetyltransferase [Parasedimentitalea marina]AZV77437.1 N-acetyltransferase [Parasedimentitalea marina]
MTLAGLTAGRLQGGDWRQLSPDDLATLFKPEVVEFLPHGFQGLLTEPDQRAFLTALSSQAEVLALFEETGAGVGLVILSHADPDSTERHLGYLLAQRIWGQGLATGLIAGLQDLYRGTDVTLCGGVMQGNTASARLLQRAGFQGRDTGDEVVYCWSGNGH